ncbi:TRAP-type C4-dicarboxylate transport system permease small subunit [Haloactinopolyspora alba]|uniref:TRAP-type C4-dicarboxylate transport system permease small subunit n=1 Tax=Haloactinopolyspora alba TaxID=648780 RepID=A0A2P8E9H7_9ACTN|nr:TRAP transporter small permease [Haloactinopolyspora alba]PSL06120.1 TRAP-type C4-dicarboxylate transport system permease small subunit [Haloactinopolyspora alba]
MSTVSRLLDRVHAVLLAAIAVLLAVLTVVVAYQVFGRYLPLIPRALWTEEIARLCLEWTVFLGAAAAVRRGDHFVIDLIPARLDAWLARPVQLVAMALVLVMSLVITVGGFRFALDGVDQISTTSGIRLVWAYAAIPVSGVLMVVFAIELAAKALTGTVTRGGHPAVPAGGGE